MSVRYFELLRDVSPKGNYIPSGRQLPRTPPLIDVKRHLDFSNEDSTVGCEEPQHNTEADTGDQDDHDQNRTFDFNTRETKTEPDDSMLKGMKGYQLTAGDLEFIRRMKEEKLIKKYQGDLEEVRRLLKKETMALELACSLRATAQAELNKFPSCEELAEWVKVVLRMTVPSTDLTGLDTNSLLAMVTNENIQRTMDEKRVQLALLEKMVANKRKKEAEERGWCEQQIANEQVKMQGLMSQLSDLTLELAQEEEAYKTLQAQIKTQEEIEADTSDEQHAAKSQRKRWGKERKKAVRSAEKLLDTANKSKPTRGKRATSKTDNETIVKDDHTNKSTREPLKSSTEEQMKQTKAAAERPTKSVKAARWPQKKVSEQESNSQVSLRVVRGRKKPPETTQSVVPQPKNHLEMRSIEAQPTSQQAAPSRGRKKTTVAADDAAEEAQSAGLRRSRRIASRR